MIQFLFWIVIITILFSMKNAFETSMEYLVRLKYRYWWCGVQMQLSNYLNPFDQSNNLRLYCFSSIDGKRVYYTANMCCNADIKQYHAFLQHHTIKLTEICKQPWLHRSFNTVHNIVIFPFILSHYSVLSMGTLDKLTQKSSSRIEWHQKLSSLKTLPQHGKVFAFHWQQVQKMVGSLNFSEFNMWYT